MLEVKINYFNKKGLKNCTKLICVGEQEELEVGDERFLFGFFFPFFRLVNHDFNFQDLSLSAYYAIKSFPQFYSSLNIYLKN